jgi:DNA invertase Pin-like site-specific DNA recombinase
MIGIYCRKSKKVIEGKDLSIPTQKEEGVKFAASLGMNYKFFVDEGLSGTLDEIEDRPDFAELLIAIKKNEITVVYAIDQSRIERNPGIWNQFVYIMLNKSCKYYPSGQFFDLNVPENILISTILSANNQFFAALTSRKVKLAIAKNAKDGKTHGLTPYGYKKDEQGYYEINIEEAKTVKRIFELSLGGSGAYIIAKILNQDGIPTKFNSFKGDIKRKDEYTKKVTLFSKKDVIWRGNVIHDMIKNPVYKGKRRWNKQEFQTPAIIDEELWDAVNKNLPLNKKNVGRREEYQYLLNGIIYCADCGNEFRGKKRLKGNDNSYKCKGRVSSNLTCSTSRGISIPKLETFIIQHLFINKQLKKHLLSIPVNSEEIDSLRVKQNKIQGQLVKLNNKISMIYERLYDDFFKDDPKIKIDYSEAQKQKSILEDSLTVVEKRIFEREDNNTKKRIKNMIGKYSIDSDFDSTKKLVHSLIERITISHTKEKKSGFFIVQIKYTGFEEHSIFTTNWEALKWNWMNHYVSKPRTKKELKEDRELQEYLNKKKGLEIEISKDFKGFPTTVTSEHQIIQLKRDELIDFS